MKQRKIIIAVLLSLSCISGIFAQSNPPGSTSSYTLEDLYNRLLSGAVGAQRTFTEPTSGSGINAMYTLNEIMAITPTADNTNGVLPSQVLIGKTFWGLCTDGTWGLKAGSMPDKGAITYTPSTSEQAITAGYHNGSGKVTGDVNLIAANIKKGVTIFGVTGTAETHTKFQIGDSFGGGIVFFVQDVETGQRGLIAAPYDENGIINLENAISVCTNKTTNGKDDRYLPDKNELNLMYQQRTLIGGFIADWYLSSTLDPADYLNAWSQHFGTGQQLSQSHGFKYKIRAIRAF